MPSRGAVLDSPPVELPPARPQNLKRTASTASLLTPPRTVRKRGRGGTRSLALSSDEDLEKEEERGDVSNGRKKRRTLDKLAEALSGGDEEEDEFWSGSSAAQDEEKEASPGPRTPAKRVVLDRIRAPVSPPPSRPSRRRTILPPVTPPKTRRSTRRTVVPEPARDTPDNPFLENSSSPLVGTLGEPRTPSPVPEEEERPTITYVFRGKKAEFVNPHYNVSPSARQRSLLAPEHPDFSPSEACPPRLLFPSVRRRKPTQKAQKRPRTRAHSPSPWDTTDDEAEASLPNTSKNKRETPERKDRGISVANGEKDEPIRRALGPPRAAKR